MGDPKQHPPSVTLSPGNLGSIHQRLARQTGSIKIYATDFAGNKACVKIYNMKRKLLAEFWKLSFVA